MPVVGKSLGIQQDFIESQGLGVSKLRGGVCPIRRRHCVIQPVVRFIRPGTRIFIDLSWRPRAIRVCPVGPTVIRLVALLILICVPGIIYFFPDRLRALRALFATIVVSAGYRGLDFSIRLVMPLVSMPPMNRLVSGVASKLRLRIWLVRRRLIITPHGINRDSCYFRDTELQEVKFACAMPTTTRNQEPLEVLVRRSLVRSYTKNVEWSAFNELQPEVIEPGNWVRPEETIHV